MLDVSLRNRDTYEALGLARSAEEVARERRHRDCCLNDDDDEDEEGERVIGEGGESERKPKDDVETKGRVWDPVCVCVFFRFAVGSSRNTYCRSAQDSLARGI